MITGFEQTFFNYKTFLCVFAIFNTAFNTHQICATIFGKEMQKATLKTIDSVMTRVVVV